MGKVLDRSININYSLENFGEKERTSIEIAKREAVRAMFSANEVKEIGSGSEGRTTVYKADQKAIKVICWQTKKCSKEEDLNKEKELFYKNVEDDYNNRESILNEIQCWMKLKPTDNIIPMTDFQLFSWSCPEYNRIGTDCAIKMALAKCMTDTEEKPESEKDILQIGIDLSTALIALHKNKLIHRDIKPANIFLYNGKFCLGDFGIAVDKNNPQYLPGGYFKEEVKGTHAYAAPEQAKGDPADYRSDIYSLGLVLYELADHAPMSSHYNDRINNHKLPELTANISDGLKTIISNACEYNQECRYQTAEEFKEDLCRLNNDPDYIPASTRTKFEQKNRTPNAFHKFGTESSSNTLPPNSRFRRFGVNSQQNLERYLTPETAWNAGKFWYEESCKTGGRFNGLYIDKNIMPLTSPETHITDLPVNVTMDPESNSTPIPLAKILEHSENLHNMYLIGEGGIGKTTALYSIMKDTYNDKESFLVSQNKNLVIPLFIELSKAPIKYCKAYENSQSTFIQRYLFMLIGSLSENHLIFENSYEMTSVMKMESHSIINNVRTLLKNGENKVKYLLLLDGLNEVSRNQLIDTENNYIDTPSDLIIDEIQELLKHSNISVVITSRTNETIGALDNEFKRLYLTGVSEPVIEEYLSENKISFASIKENKRLMETLKIPLFLKLYSQLYSISGISTPGEILYTFFSERSMQYSARNRITEITRDRRNSGNIHADSLADEKMQWFILDFLLPELGWYMEKNDLYTVDQTTIKNVMDIVLKGTAETDICGKYGIAMFDDYHNGNDGSVNVKTYADKLLALDSSNRSYVQEIVDYCVYSLGILYVNNQDYGFIHQHIRDFFAALNIITDMKIASHICDTENSAELGRLCLTCLTKDLLSEKVVRLIGEILCEYHNTPIYIDGNWKNTLVKGKFPSHNKNRRFLITDTLELFRNYFPDEKNVDYAVWNLLKIMYTARKTLAGTELRDLDLRNCSLNNIELYDADLTGCLMNQQNIFSSGHDNVITKAVVSKSGKYVLTSGYDGKLKLWHLKTAKCIKDIKEYDSPINSISISSDYIAVSTPKCVEILEESTYKSIKKYNAYFGLFSPNGKYLLLFFKTKKAQLIRVENNNFSIIGKLNYPIKSSSHYGIPLFNDVAFSPDSKYVVFKPMHLSKSCVELWNTEKCQFVSTIYTCHHEAISIITFSTDGKYLIMSDTLSHFKIFSLDTYSGETFLIHEVWVKNILENDISFITCAHFTLNDKYLVIGNEHGKLYLCSFKSLFASSNGINEECEILTGHSSSITSICEYSIGGIPYIITSSFDCNVKNWNLQTKKCISSFHKGNSSSTLSACYILGGKYIVISGNSRELLMFDPNTGKYVERIGTIEDYTWKLAYHPGTQQLAVALDNGEVTLFHYEEHVFVRKNTIKLLNEYIRDVKFSPDGSKISAFSWLGNEFAIYDITNNCIIPFSKEHGFTGIGTFSFPSGKNILACLNASDSIGYFDSQTGNLEKIGHSYFNPYQNNLLFKLFEESTNIPYERPIKEATAIAYSKDGKYLIIGRFGGIIEIWNKEESITEEKCMAIIHSFYSDTTKIAVSSDGSCIAFSTQGPNLKIYRMQDIKRDDYGKEIQNWKCKYDIRGSWRFQFKETLNALYRCIYKTKNGHKDVLIDIEFSPTQKQLLTTSYDQTIKVWELDEGNIANRYHISPTCLHTIEFMPGLKVKGAIFKNLHPNSNFSSRQQALLETYGAIFR